MKRLITTAAFAMMFILAAVTTSNAQQNYNWSQLWIALENQSSIDFQIDFSDAYIDNVPAAQFIEKKKEEKDWDVEFTKMQVRFLRKFNNRTMKTSSSLTAGNRPDAPIILIIKVIDVTDRGANILAKCIIKRKLDGQILFCHSVQTDKGVAGSVLNLMGDSFEEMGEFLGKKVKRNVE